MSGNYRQYQRMGRRVYGRRNSGGRRTAAPLRRSATTMTTAPSPNEPTPYTGVQPVTYIVAAICVVLLALVLFAYSKQPDNSAPSNAGSCEQDWQNHVAAAQSYGYPAGDHTSFVKSCNDTITALHDAVSSQNN